MSTHRAADEDPSLPSSSERGGGGQADRQARLWLKDGPALGGRHLVRGPPRCMDLHPPRRRAGSCRIDSSRVRAPTRR